MSTSELTVHWSTLRVEHHDLTIPTTLTDVKRLAELLNWRRGRKPSYILVFDFITGLQMMAPGDIDWSGFPIGQAHQEIMDQELRAAAIRFRMGVKASGGVRITVL